MAADCAGKDYFVEGHNLFTGHVRMWSRAFTIHLVLCGNATVQLFDKAKDPLLESVRTDLQLSSQ